MQSYHTSISLMGDVSSVDPAKAVFSLRLLTGDTVEVHVSKTTQYTVLINIGDDQRDRVVDPDQTAVEQALGGSRSNAGDQALWDAKRQLFKYLKPDLMVCMLGVCSEHGGAPVYSARRIVLMHSEPKKYGWEETHWWLQQINTLFEQWLDKLFQTRRELTENDFSEFYRTNLNIVGGPTEDNTQECATLSRFLYGLSSAYLLTGNARALSAAKACARYIVNAYASPSHDGEYILWKFGRKKDDKGVREIIGSLNPDDYGTFALYEQIYVLSGLTQYYRATQDTVILGYIVRTIKAFEHFYRDFPPRPNDPCYTGQGGYFSHLDPVTMRPDSPSLRIGDSDNRAKKNWNSIGDHIPAYLINLLISIDPLPEADEAKFWEDLRSRCRDMLDDCVGNILEHFGPTEDEEKAGVLFVNERFDKDWHPDHTWGWQQNRGIVGHNLKISWNLTRCAHYYRRLVDEAQRDGDTPVAEKYSELAGKCEDFARRLGHNMKEVGVDLARGGIFDALERQPANDLQTEFAWSTTKDFWQQEQAILAYYIMHRIGDEAERHEFLKLARFCAAFWSLFFVNQDERRIFFRTTESGGPVIEGQYGMQSGHAIAGYHSFELNYLAHLYIRTYVDRHDHNTDSFVLHYRPLKGSNIRTLNVMPDFFRPEDLKIINIKINGVQTRVRDQHKFQISIADLPEDSVILVEYLPIGRAHVETERALRKRRAPTAPLQVAYDTAALKLHAS